MTSGVGSSKATVAGVATPGPERQAASALGTRAMAADNELKSRILPTPGNGQLHGTRLRFGSRLESYQAALIPENSAKMHCVAVFERPREAESAIRELQGAGFDMKKLSIVGKENDEGEHAVGLQQPARDDVQYWAKEGTFWGGVFGVLFWPALFFIPGVGPVLTAGLIGATLIGTVEAAAVGAVIGGTASAFVAALGSWGLAKDVVTGYEADLNARRILLIASGNSAELVGVRPILTARGAKVNVHSP